MLSRPPEREATWCASVDSRRRLLLGSEMATFEQSLKQFLDHYEELNSTLGPNNDDGFYKEFMVRGERKYSYDH